MLNWFWRVFGFKPQSDLKEKDLPAMELLESNFSGKYSSIDNPMTALLESANKNNFTRNISPTSNVPQTPELYIENGVQNNSSTIMTLTSYFKNLFISRFKYEGVEEDDVDFKYFENLLFTNGSAVIIKRNGKLECYTYIVKEFDYQQKPKIIQPVRAGETTDTQGNKTNDAGGSNEFLLKEVDVKDCVYMWTDYGGFFNSQESFSPFIRAYSIILTLIEIRKEIVLNIKRLKNKLVILTNNPEDVTELNRILRMLDSDSSAIQMDVNSLVAKALSGVPNSDSIMVEFRDNTDALQANYKFLNDDLKIHITHMDVNDSIQKKERLISDEVNMSNTPTRLVLLLEEELRKEMGKRYNKLFNRNISVSIREAQDKIEEVEPGKEPMKEKNNE